ncbi:MAG: PA2169 family four-helix-bundle protein [Gammaproteobacteria bacterium]|nr:MAG: PA2169 family four-helix-bundle protein [Gammaproteobacteria bacterium]
MHTDTATLKDLVEVLNDGKKFYEEASHKVKRPELAQLFSRMATTKSAIADDLAGKIKSSGENAPKGGSFSGTLHKAYSDVRAKLSSSPDGEYVAQLEDFEDRIVHAFRDAAGSSKDADVRALANRYLPDVLRDHGEMSNLKQQMRTH